MNEIYSLLEKSEWITDIGDVNGYKVTIKNNILYHNNMNFKIMNICEKNNELIFNIENNFGDGGGTMSYEYIYWKNNIIYYNIEYLKTLTLNEYLFNEINIDPNGMEGGTHKEQGEFLSFLAKDKKNILEIGFNAGNSSEYFLKTNKESMITSFDIGFFGYNNLGYYFLRGKYNDRIKIIFGDSNITIPNYIKENKNTTFDLIFIDGGHEYKTVFNDVENCKNLCNKDSIIIMDNVDLYKDEDKLPPWEFGPTKVMKEMLFNKTFFLHGFWRGDDGYAAMAWGNFL